MLNKIFKTAGATALSVFLLVGSASIAAAVTILPTTSTGTGAAASGPAVTAMFPSTVIRAVNGDDPPIGGGTLAAGDTFLDEFVIDVQNLAGQPVNITYDVTQENPGNSNVGIANLRFEWNNDGSVITFTDGAGVAQFGTSVIFSRVLATGINTFRVRGTVLSQGGDYTAVITAVPLPPAALLFGSALLGIGALRRRKENSAAA